MDLPDFLIIGAPRSGTTSLYNYLRQHPRIFMSPQKEARFFAHEHREADYQGPADAYAYNRKVIGDADAYRELFEGRTSDQLAGEASPVYLYRSEQAAPRIHHHVPEAKLIANFRNPVERAYSDFLNMVRLGWEPIHDFERALADEERRIDAHWSPFYRYRAKGFYADRLQAYFDYFDREQMRFFLFREFQEEPSSVVREAFAFLDVDPEVPIDTQSQHNRSGLPRSQLLHRLLTHPVAEWTMRGPLRRIRTTLRDWNTAYEKPPMDPAVRKDLEDGYREDVRKLEALIDRDLSHWLS